MSSTRRHDVTRAALVQSQRSVAELQAVVRLYQTTITQAVQQQFEPATTAVSQDQAAFVDGLALPAGCTWDWATLARTGACDEPEGGDAP